MLEVNVLDVLVKGAVLVHEVPKKEQVYKSGPPQPAAPQEHGSEYLASHGRKFTLIHGHPPPRNP